MRTTLFGLAISLVSIAATGAETHLVKMLNRGASGSMVYEPEYLHIQPGDTVKFINASPSHNAATMEGMVPEGFKGFRGQANQELEIKLDQPGFYGIKCSPHYAMGMVMVIKVGNAALPKDFLDAKMPPRARIRFEEIFSRVHMQN